MTNRPESIGLYARIYQQMLDGSRPFMQVPPDALVRALALEGIAPGKGRSQALDFGCGEGRNAAYLANAGYEVTAIDVSESAIAATRKRLGDDGDFRLIAPDEHLPIKDTTVDLIISWEVMHWLGSKESFSHYLSEFRRVLASGGRLVMTMPRERHFLKTLSIEIGQCQYKAFEETREGCVLYAPNLATLERIIKKTGLQLYRTLFYEHGDGGGGYPSLELPFSMYVFVAGVE